VRESAPSHLRFNPNSSYSQGHNHIRGECTQEVITRSFAWGIWNRAFFWYHDYADAAADGDKVNCVVRVDMIF
jgi:hypothetical protein